MYDIAATISVAGATERDRERFSRSYRNALLRYNTRLPIFDNLRPGPVPGTGDRSLYDLLENQAALESVARSVNAPIFTAVGYTIHEYFRAFRVALNKIAIDARGGKPGAMVITNPEEMLDVYDLYGSLTRVLKPALREMHELALSDFLVSDLHGDCHHRELFARLVDESHVGNAGVRFPGDTIA